MNKKEDEVVLNDGHWIEIQDRAHVLVEMFESVIADHPAVIETDALRLEAERLGEQLANFYQLVGQVRPDW